jgi:hypothetical protein
MQISFWEMTECQNPEERSPQLRHCENFKTQHF